MTGRLSLSALLLGLLSPACAGSSSSAEEPAPSSLGTSDAAADSSMPLTEATPVEPATPMGHGTPVMQAECPDGTLLSLDEDERTETLVAWASRFEHGAAILDGCDESCRMTSNGNGATQLTMNGLAQMAIGGYLPAQSLFGRELLNTLMTTGAEPELEDNYVTAMYFLWLAAWQGDEAVLTLVPELGSVVLSRDAGFVPATPTAFKSLDHQWIVRAYREAASVRHCYDASAIGVDG